MDSYLNGNFHMGGTNLSLFPLPRRLKHLSDALRGFALFLMLTFSTSLWAEEEQVERLLTAFEKEPSASSANTFLDELHQLTFLDEPIQFSPQDGLDTLRQQVWYWAAEWFYDVGEYDKADHYAREALPLIHTESVQADCLNLLAIIHVRTSDYIQAISYAKQVYELDKRSGDAERQGSSLNTLAGIYLSAQQPEEAEPYVLRGIELVEQTDNTALLAILQGMASEIYHAQGKDEEALTYADAAYQLDKQAGRLSKATIRLAQKASVLIGLQRYAEAERVLTEIIPIFRKEDEQQSLGISCNKMGQVLRMQQRSAEAVPYYREAAQIFSSLGDMANELQAHRGLYETLWKMNPDEAKRELDAFNALRDSIYNNVSAECLAKYNAEFGNDWLQMENAEEREAKHWAILIGILATTLLLALLIVVWWVMNRRHHEQKDLNAHLTSDITQLRQSYRQLNIEYDHAMLAQSHEPHKDYEAYKSDETHETDEANKPSEPMLSEADQTFLSKASEIANRLINEGQVDAASVAKEMSMSLYQFRGRLTSTTGETPQAFIQNIRMKRACQLLERQELTIAEVAILCAYNDAPSFTRSFKNTFGITPSQYKLNKEKSG